MMNIDLDAYILAKIKEAEHYESDPDNGKAFNNALMVAITSYAEAVDRREKKIYESELWWFKELNLYWQNGAANDETRRATLVALNFILDIVTASVNVVKTYKDFEDREGEPCPDIARLNEILNRSGFVGLTKED